MIARIFINLTKLILLFFGFDIKNKFLFSNPKISLSKMRLSNTTQNNFKISTQKSLLPVPEVFSLYATTQSIDPLRKKGSVITQIFERI